MSEDLNSLAAKQALADPKLQDFSWITKMPRKAIEALLKLIHSSAPAQNPTRRTTALDEAIKDPENEAAYDSPFLKR